MRRDREPVSFVGLSSCLVIFDVSYDNKIRGFPFLPYEVIEPILFSDSMYDKDVRA